MYDCRVFVSLPLSIVKSMPPKRKRVQAYPKNKWNQDSGSINSGNDSGPTITVHSAASIDQL